MHLLLQTRRQSLDTPKEMNLHVVLVHLLQLFRQIIREQLHEEIHLRSGPLPVLCRERIDRKRIQFEADGRLKDVLECLDARLVTSRTQQALACGPAAVTIHNDGYMTRQALPLYIFKERRIMLRNCELLRGAQAAENLFKHSCTSMPQRLLYHTHPCKRTKPLALPA